MSDDLNAATECEQAKESCERLATTLVREAPPGNPYRDLRVCDEHTEEMVASGLYFQV